MAATDRTRPLASALSQAVRLQMVTLAWMLVEAAAGIGAALAARSMLLLVFGMDSVLELASASLLVYRLRLQRLSDAAEMDRVEAVELRTARASGWLLIALAAFVLVEGVYGLLQRQGAGFSALGITVAAVAAICMPFLARARLRLAEEIGSAALRADAVESLACGYLAWAVLAGQVATTLLRWWWLDRAVALLLIPYLVKEGRAAITGECCGKARAE